MKYIPKKNWKLTPQNVTNAGVAAEIIGCHPSQITRWIKADKIKYVWVGEGYEGATKLLYMPDVLRIRKQRSKKAQTEGK